jgi:Ni/Co efflux regulator RcnB
MKYMITAAVALTLLASGAAMAQDGPRHEGGRGGGGGYRGGQPGGQQAQPQQAPVQQAPAQAAPQQQQRQDFQRGVPRNRAGQEVFQGGQRGDRGQGGPAPQQRFDRGGGQNFDRGQNRGDQNRGDQYRGGGDQRRFDGGRQDFRGGNDRRFDRGGRQEYRPGGFLSERGWRGGQRFRADAYRYPRGFGYQTWAFGAFLPGAFLAPDYTIGDYWTYGLPAPPPGFHWIRVGPDALLVRYGDGYVLDAAYGLFY